MKEDNNEFENLYKKAAENFPLKTDSADWQSVLSALEDDDRKTPFVINRKVLTLSMLLLLVSMLYVTTLIKHQSTLSDNINEKKQIVKQDTEAQQQNSKLKQEITDAVYKKVYDSINSQKKQSTSNIEEAKKTSLSDIKKENKLDNNKSNYINNNITFNTAKQQKPKSINIKKADVKNTSNKTKDASSNLNNYNLITNSNSPQTESSQAFLSKKSEYSTITNNVGKKQLNAVIDNINSETITVAKSDSIIKPISKILVVDSSKKPVASTPKKSTSIFSKYFYVGALYAFDNTSEKNEKHSNEKGENFGISLLLGYRISPKISIETGIAYQNKEYYTSGNYFNKSILGATGNVNGIEAENNFIEIPLALKYDWLNKKQHNIFTTIGLSSYFVNKEKYEYDQEIGGVYNKQFVEFSTVTTNLFATCNFSFGYQFNFKKLGSLRVQPYINLPLKGLGKSQEYLVSRGINVGWIYNFNKK